MTEWTLVDYNMDTVVFKEEKPGCFIINIWEDGEESTTYCSVETARQIYSDYRKSGFMKY